MTQKRLLVLLAAMVTFMLAPWVQAQQAPGAGAPQQPQGDQVDQLAQALGLSEEQQSEIRALVEEMGDDIESRQGEAQRLQMELSELVGHEYDESEIRSKASRLGELTGEMTALSALLQSRVQAIFTPDQREELERQAQQQQQMQQQMMEQQQQQQQAPQQQAPQQQAPQQQGQPPAAPDW